MATRSFFFLHFAAMGVFLPYFPVWLETQGVTGFRMSLVLAILPLLSIVAPSGFGVLADAFGWRGGLLRVATFGAFVAMASLAFVRGALGWLDFEVILLAAMAFGFFRTPMQLIGDVVALEQPVDYARVRMWGSVGFMIVAPVVGGFVPEGGPWLLPASMALLLGATHASSWLLPKGAPLPAHPFTGGLRALVSEPHFRALLATAAFGHCAHVAYEVCLSLKLRDLGASGTWIGVAWTVATLFEVLLMAFSRHLFARFSAASLLLFSLVACVARWLFFWQVDDVWLLLLLQPAHAITFALRWVASVALVRRLGPEGALATAQGLFLACTALGSALGMLLWGTLYESVGSRVFLGASLVSLLAVAIALPLSNVPAGSRVTEEIESA